MSDSVVIRKSERDELAIVASHHAPHLLEALRAAPETVSLEGVDEVERAKAVISAWAQEHGYEASFVPDLHRLAAPVHPSAVNTTDKGKLAREVEIALAYYSDVVNSGARPFTKKGEYVVHHLLENGILKIDQPTLNVVPIEPSAVVSRDLADRMKRFLVGNLTIQSENPELFELKYSILKDLDAIPQPVAPVQSVGVDLTGLVEKWRKERANYHHLSQTHYVIASFLADIAHLTTTQRAPVSEGRRSLGWLVQNWAEINKVIIGPHTAASLADALSENGYLHPEAPSTQSAPSVPSREELDEVYNRSYEDCADAANEYQSSGRAWPGIEPHQAGIKAIHTLLIERQGSKP